MIEIKNNQVLNNGIKVGDVKLNEVSQGEADLLYRDFNLNLNLWEDSIIYYVCSEDRFKDLLKESKGILIFRDINGNFAENFNIYVECPY